MKNTTPLDTIVGIPSPASNVSHGQTTSIARSHTRNSHWYRQSTAREMRECRNRLHLNGVPILDFLIEEYRGVNHLLP